MTTNLFEQNTSIKLADDYLSTLLTENVMTFPVDLTKNVNSVSHIDTKYKKFFKAIFQYIYYCTTFSRIYLF